MLILGLVDIPTWIILLLAIAILLYWFGTRNHGFFKKHGIPGPKPLPFLGNMLDFSQDMGTLDAGYKKKYGNIVGTFTGCQPTFIIYDEEMISQVTVKQFHAFPNRMTMRIGDEIMDNMLVSMEGDIWKHTRSIMSPTFTTGKLRQMADEINRCAKQLTKAVTACEEPFETREKMSAFTMDVIASAGFGLRVDSQSGKADDPFIINGRRVVDISFTNPLLIIAFLCQPLGKIMYRLGLYSAMNYKAVRFFTSIIKQTLDGRAEGDKTRADFLQLMKNATMGKTNYSKEDEHEVDKHATVSSKQGLSEVEILANGMVFFLAGFDTTSIGLTQLMYCLAINQDCQQKLHEEIDSVLGDKTDVSYDDVMKIQYLDQCIQESLRLYPPSPRIDRVASQDITINGVFIPKGSSVNIPVAALQKDPDIWEDPERFNPDRFSPEEKAKRSSLAWMPFGYGPRNCIGMRLALYEIKVAVVHVLRNHKIVTCEKTEDPIQWTPGMLLKAKNGIWLQCAKRN